MKQPSVFTAPSVFVAHGTPMLALATPEDDPFIRTWFEWAQKHPKPRAIAVVSAHTASDGDVLRISAAPECYAIHDFGGFPEDLYEIDYRPKGDPALAEKIGTLLVKGGIKAVLHQSGALDHGIWVPLRAAYPDADIPVVSVSFPQSAKPHLTMKLGQLLAPLRHEGVMMLGSGGVVHNLRELVWHHKNTGGDPRALKFEEWVVEKLKAKDVASLVDFETKGPDSNWANPTTEHFFPLLFSVGATLPGDQANVLYRGVQYGSLSMLTVELTG